MKKFFTFLFKQPDNPNIPRPIFIVGFVIMLIAFGIYKFGGSIDFSSSKSPNAQVSQPANEENFIDKIKSIFNKKDSSTASTNKFVPPSISSIPSDLLTIDQSLLDQADSLMQERFSMEKIDLSDIGKKDPMKPLSKNDNANAGAGIGVFDKNKVDNRPSDLKDESKNYYDGLSLDNLVLNSIRTNENQIVEATFLAMGGIFTVHEGDFLGDIYYVKKINLKSQKVILEYNAVEHELTAQNIISSDKLNK